MLRLAFVRGEFLRSAHSLPKWTARARKTYHVPGRTAKIYCDHVERLVAEEVRGKVGVVQLRTRTFHTFPYATAPTLESRGNLHDGKADLLTRAAVAGHRLWIRFTVGAAAI